MATYKSNTTLRENTSAAKDNKGESRNWGQGGGKELKRQDFKDEVTWYTQCLRTQKEIDATDTRRL